MQKINTPKAAKDLAGKKEKKLILLKDQKFSTIYNALESKFREFSQNTAGADAFPGTADEGRKLSEAHERMRVEKQIPVEEFEEIKAIFRKFKWDLVDAEEKEDESRVYGKDHLWNRNNAARIDRLREISRTSQTQTVSQIDPRDEAEVSAIAKSLGNGTITDDQIQVLGRIYKKYIKK